MKKWIVLLISLLFVSGILYTITARLYPVLIVNSRFVSARDFDNAFAAASNYYERAADLDKSRGLNPVINPQSQKSEIKRAILDSLIEDSLIEEELQKRIKKNDLEAMVVKNIDNALKDNALKLSDIEKEVEVIYGVSLRDFKKTALAPQAKREILEGRLLLGDNTKSDVLGQWLQNAKAKAKIFILLPGFEWNGKEITIK